MGKKRGAGEGTIVQLPSGSWRGQITLDRGRLSFTAKTRREVQDWIRKMAVQVDAGLSYDGATTSVTEFMHGWLQSAQPSLRAKTHQQYTQVARDHILPYIGHMKLLALRPDQVQKMYDRLLANGNSARIVQLSHSILHRALDSALKMGSVTRNVTDATTPARPKKRTIQVLTEEELDRLLVAAEGHRYKVLVYLAVVTGMREGELFGLRWSDIDWLTGEIHITRQVQDIRGQGAVYVDPKTDAGRRTVVIGAQVVELLKWQYQWVGTMRRFDKRGIWKEHDLVFPSTRGTPIIHSNFHKEWKKILEAAKLPHMRFHDLRHLAASILLVKLRKSPTEVAAILGHAKTSTTLDIYGHMLPGMSQQTASEIEAVVMPTIVKQDTDEKRK